MKSTRSTHHFWLIPGRNSARMSLRDDTIKCTDWRTNTFYCYTLTGQQIWTFKDENVLRVPRGIALDKNKTVYVVGRETQNVVVLSPDGKNCRQILAKSDGLNESIPEFYWCLRPKTNWSPCCTN
jgi:outer membrane protein assembly factor BamB